MSLRSAIWRLGDVLADDYARSWSIGAWFVVSFAAVGFFAQVWWGLAFRPALLASILVATTVVLGRAHQTTSAASTSTSEELLFSKLSDFGALLQEQTRLLDKQYDQQAREAEALASIDRNLRLLLEQQSDLLVRNTTVPAFEESVTNSIAEVRDLNELQVNLFSQLVSALRDGQVAQIKAFEDVVRSMSKFASAPREDDDDRTGYTVVLTAPGANKIKVIKAVREVTSLGLKEAKDLVDQAPKPVKEGIGKDEAEAIKRKFSEAGATVELELPSS